MAKKHLKTKARKSQISNRTLPDLALLSELEAFGRFELMEVEAKNLIRQYGSVPVLQRQLGLSLFHQKRFEEARECFEKVSVAMPKDVNSWNHLALSLNRLGYFTEAHEAYLKGAKLAQDIPAILSNMGNNLISAGRYSEAGVYLRRAIEIDGGLHEARVNLARLMFKQGNLIEARTLLEGLLAEGVRSESCLTNYGSLLNTIGDGRALLILREALQIAPPSAELLYALSEAERNFGSDKEAASLIDRVLEIDPLHPFALLSKAQSLLTLGKFAMAEQFIKQAMTKESDLPEAISMLPLIRKMTTADAAWMRQAERIVAQQLPPWREVHLRFAMGKYCDDVKDYDRAFVNYERGNLLKKSLCESYDRQYRVEIVEQIIRTYKPEMVRKNHMGASSSRMPVFIVGMPRSGTSLLEQIIASHPDAQGAGELYFWGNQASKFLYQFLHAVFDESFMTQSSAAYLEQLQHFAANALRVVDKMPVNFQYLGLIHAVFPEARIIHAQRNPIDTCLSIYFQDFSKLMVWANDLDDIAHYYREYQRLMKHWCSVLPPDIFLDVPYESLVEDQEGWSKKIIEFIGLEWNDRCLGFYNTERRVGTASNWQARQPIYNSSKERWRNYEKFVEPLLLQLDAGVDNAATKAKV